MIFKLPLYIFLFCLLIGFTSCGEREIFLQDPLTETPNNQTALGFIGYLEGLDTLERILNVVDWRANLTNQEGFTFFTPTNEAFSALVSENENWNSVRDIPEAEMIAILDYHLVPNLELILSDTIAEYVPTTLSSAFDTPTSIFLKTEGSIRINGERTLALQDVELSDGTLQLVDEIARPVTVRQLIKANPNLSTLNGLVERTNFSQNFEEVLESTGPFTIFAPVDSAFQNLTQALEVGSVDQIPTEILEPTLLQHISLGANLSAMSLTPNTKVTTLNTNSIEIKNSSSNFGAIQGLRNRANIIAVDGQGTNGVIHLLDGVLTVE